MNPFDKEAVYDSEIAPLMSQVIEICKREGVPMLATFAYAKGKDKDDPEGVEYCTTLLPREGHQTPEIMEAMAIIEHGASVRPKLFAFTITTKGTT